MRVTRSAAFIFSTFLLASPLRAEQTAAARPAADPVRREAAEVAAAWTLLADGHIDRAAQKAQQVLNAHPRSAAALAVAVAAASARDGAKGGLGVYDRWIGSRTLEEPLVLRSLALVVVREGSKQTEDAIARGEALRALRRAGEPGQQDDAAVGEMIDNLREAASSAQSMKLVEALGAAGTPQALKGVLASADDPRMEIRGAAAEALGRFPGDEARARLTQLLSDRVLWVRARAAGALLQLGDESGLAMLRGLAAESEPSVRLLAAGGLAARPDAAWLALVRDLAGSSNAEISASAAVLLAPHDPARAGEILAGLQSNENPAIRDLARINKGEIAVESSNLTDLRLALHAEGYRARTRAAARILDLTR